MVLFKNVCSTWKETLKNLTNILLKCSKASSNVFVYLFHLRGNYPNVLWTQQNSAIHATFLFPKSKRYSKFKGCYWSFETHPLKKPLTSAFCLDCMLSIIRGRKGWKMAHSPLLALLHHIRTSPLTRFLAIEP